MNGDFISLDIVKSLTRIRQLAREGIVKLYNTQICLDGKEEIDGSELVLRTLHLKNCTVQLKNVNLVGEADALDCSILLLEKCEDVSISDCQFQCQAIGSDKAPYPKREKMSSSIYCFKSRADIRNCVIKSTGNEARGIVVDDSTVTIASSTIQDCHGSGVWCRGESKCAMTDSRVENCGGYGALYCTNGASLSVERTRQSGNPRGCGVFVLHEGSRVQLDRSSFDANKWSGFGCRWSGGGAITNCSFDSNGQGAWAIRRSTIKDIIRQNNVVTNDFTDKFYSKVAFLFSDPLSTALVQKGLTSRGLSVARARDLVDGERRMREATRYDAKFLYSRHK